MKNPFVRILLAIVIVAIIILVAGFLMQSQRQRLIDSVFAKWNTIASNKGKVIDEYKIKPELNRLTDEELIFLDRMSQLAVEKRYLAMLGNLTETKRILQKTDLVNIASGLIFQIPTATTE